MKTNKSFKKTALVSGALLTGSLIGINPLNAASSDLYTYSDLGSGAELRSELLEQNQSPFDVVKAAEGMTTVKFSELKCGEGKCGEGKCGEGDKEKGDKEKKEAKKENTAKDSKESKTASSESEKSDKKEGKKEAKKDKTSESKCGEGKCA